MKKKLMILMVAMMIGSGYAYSQVAFGLKGGLNLAQLDLNDPEFSYDSRTGFHAGIFLRGKFDKVAIQPEVLFFTQNGDLKSTMLGFGTVKESFTYLSIPLILKFYPVAGLNLQAGPQFGFLVDGEREYNNSVFGSGKQDITEYYKKSDVAISVGGGYDFGFGLSLDLRYNIGVKDINNASNNEEAKSKIFLVSMGWNFLR